MSASTAEVADDAPTDVAAHALLRLVADNPSNLGRVSAARVLGGLGLPRAHPAQVMSFTILVDWPFRDILFMVDAMIKGGLVARDDGAHSLRITQAGADALSILDATRVL